MIRSRRKISWFVLVALLFTQLATAAYACAGQVSGIAGCDGAHHGARSFAHTSIDPEQPELCADHCGHGAKVQLDTHASPALLPPPLAVLWFALLPVPEEASLQAVAPGVERTAAAPVPILFGRFLS